MSSFFFPSMSKATPTPTTLTGTGVNALDIPEIARLLRTNRVRYERPSNVRVQARRANLDDLKAPLNTWVTDTAGGLVIETIKNFERAEFDSGIIIMRYPDAISGEIYNEWYVTEKEWAGKYAGTPGKEFAPYEPHQKLTKEGIIITPEVIALLGGKDGKAEIIPSWGGTMMALQDGLLVDSGSSIAPQILEKYFAGPTRVEMEGQ